MPLMCIMNKNLYLRIFSILGVVFLSCFIFYMSSKTANASNEISTSFLDGVLELLFKNYKSLPDEEKIIIIQNYHFFIRKLAHFSEFALLGIFSYFFLSTFDRIKNFLAGVIAWCYVTLFAVSDEIHQLFVEGRSGKVTDVIIDSFGGAVGILFIILIVYKIHLFREAKLNETKEKQ